MLKYPTRNVTSISLKLRFVGFGEVEIGSYKIKTEVPESVDIYHRIVKPKKCFLCLTIMHVELKLLRQSLTK